MESAVVLDTAKAQPVAQKAKKRHRPRAQKVEAQNARYHLVLEAALAVTQIFLKHHMSCAVFGSLASKLYGSSRCPKDVDLLVSQNSGDSLPDSDPSAEDRSVLDAAQLKDLILRENPRNFYLKLPRDATAEYRILWYRQYYRGPECKVDILVPGIMHLPCLAPSRVVHLTDPDTVAAAGVAPGPVTVPVVPFALLLLHKLQGWDDHRKAEEPYKNKKQTQDASDVRKLLTLRREMQALAQARPWDDVGLFSTEFQELSRERVKAYCEAFPDRVKEWKALGFETS